jgi:hypothetical protein
LELSIDFTKSLESVKLERIPSKVGSAPRPFGKKPDQKADAKAKKKPGMGSGEIIINPWD